MKSYVIENPTGLFIEMSKALGRPPSAREYGIKVLGLAGARMGLRGYENAVDWAIGLRVLGEVAASAKRGKKWKRLGVRWSDTTGKAECFSPSLES